MKTVHRPLIFTVLALLVMLLLSACGNVLAGDVTPPPDYHPTDIPPQTTTVAQVALPMVPPDPAAGASIYTEKCAPCHGEIGKGDGPQSSKLPSLPPAIGTVELARASRPADWFNIVTQGNLQKFMPGFANSLSDRQRWDVVAYVYTLSATNQELELGQKAFQQECQSCHGPQGKGDGEKAAALNGAVHDWSDPTRLVQLSAQEIHDVILQGTDKGMPAYQGKLDDAQAWALASFSRSLSFVKSAPVSEQAQASTPESGQSAAQTPAAGESSAPQSTEVAANAGKIAISGTVINASGGDIPPDAKVNLLGFDQMQQVVDLNGDVNLDGTFKFDNVDVAPDRVFMATVKYNGTTFNSDILKASDIAAGTEGRINVHIFDTTTDASTLSADRMHIFFDFTKPGLVQIGELFIISNNGNRAVVADKPGSAVMKFDLPKGATNLSFQDGTMGQEYVQTENGFGDTRGIQPGSGVHQVLFAYDLPYENGLDVSLTTPLAVQSAVIIGPAEGGVTLKSSELQDAGVRNMQNVNVHLFTASSLAAGSSLNINLSGKPGGSAGLDQNTLTGLVIGLVALALAIGLAAFWFLRVRRMAVVDGPYIDEPTDASQIEPLLDAIVALDDLYQSGQIPKEAYNQRRAELKEKLRLARDAQGQKGA